MEVIRNQVVVTVILDGVDKCTERVGITECVGFDGLEDLGKILIESVRSVVVGMSEVFNILCQVTKKEDVVLANLTSDLDLEDY